MSRADQSLRGEEAGPLRSTPHKLRRADAGTIGGNSCRLVNLHQSARDERTDYAEHITPAALRIDVVHLHERRNDVRHGDGRLKHAPDLDAHTIETVIGPVAQTEHDDFRTELAGKHVR